MPKPSTVLAALLSGVVALVAMHLVGERTGSFTLHAWFFLDGEANVPTWFSSEELALLAVTLWMTARAHAAGGDRGAAVALTCLAIAMLFFSVDETAMVHERLSAALADVSIPRIDGFRGTWVTIYAAAAALAAALNVPALGRLARRHPRETGIFVLGAALWIGGGVGVEALSWSGVVSGDREFLPEETLEMTGSAVMIYAAWRTLGAMALTVAWPTGGRSDARRPV